MCPTNMIPAASTNTAWYVVVKCDPIGRLILWAFSILCACKRRCVRATPTNLKSMTSRLSGPPHYGRMERPNLPPVKRRDKERPKAYVARGENGKKELPQTAAPHPTPVARTNPDWAPAEWSWATMR